ncbi:MAG: acetyl-CoA C-acetyltransferase [Hellea sp.]|nr:acetyl-CoA C-acetyltransferase [Hellea sp.]
MAEAYIVDATRTPTGKRRGSLQDIHGADLGAHVIKEIVERNNIPQDEYDDVVFGCLDTVGPLAGNIGRTAWLVAGYDLTVPGVTIDRQCGSSQQAVHFAAQAVMSGTQDVVIAGGVQTMSKIPIGASMIAGQTLGFDHVFHTSPGWVERFGKEPVSQFHGAEMIAKDWGFSRRDLEEYSLASHQRAAHARAEGWFDREITAINGLEQDETIRDTSIEKMAELDTLVEGGRITAAVASQTCDGSSAMLVVSEHALKRYNLTPRARIHHLDVMGDDPIYMLTGPIPATKRALKRAGMTPGDIDIAECNEAFAPVPMAWMKETGFTHDQVNVNGGAIALGHPLGSTGTKLMTTLLHELERREGRYGLQTMCEGGGVANVTIIERL